MILRCPIKDLGVLVDGLGWIGKDVKLGSTRANEGVMRYNSEWHTGGYNTGSGIKIIEMFFLFWSEVVFQFFTHVNKLWTCPWRASVQKQAVACHENGDEH